MLTSPATFGALIAAAGLVLLATPLSRMPSSPAASWWVTAFRAPNAIQAAATLLVFAASAGLALCLRRYLVVANRRAGWRAAQADVSGAGEPRVEEGAGLIRWSPVLGLALMGAGALVGTFSWFASHGAVPVSRISLPMGQTVQSYPAIQTGGAYKVMLPQRLTVTGLDVRERIATLEFEAAGSSEPTVRRLLAGQPLHFLGFNFSLLGVEYDERVPLAVLASEAADTIEAAGAKGQEVQFAIDGPTFEVVEITREYLGALGPAVQLENDLHGRFWVFERADAPPNEPSFAHGLSLRRLETSPVAVIAVARDASTQTAAAGGLLFVIGLGLFLLVGDRLVRVRRDGDDVSFAAWSVNDAGGLSGAETASGEGARGDEGEAVG